MSSLPLVLLLRMVYIYFPVRPAHACRLFPLLTLSEPLYQRASIHSARALRRFTHPTIAFRSTHIQTRSLKSMASTEREPLLRRVPSALAVPPMLIQPGVEKLDSPVTIDKHPVFPAPTFTKASFDRRKRQMPQCIAHRGYKAKYPENTMAAVSYTHLTLPTNREV